MLVQLLSPDGASLVEIRVLLPVIRVSVPQRWSSAAYAPSSYAPSKIDYPFREFRRIGAVSYEEIR